MAVWIVAKHGDSVESGPLAQPCLGAADAGVAAFLEVFGGGVDDHVGCDAMELDRLAVGAEPAAGGQREGGDAGGEAPGVLRTARSGRGLPEQPGIGLGAEVTGEGLAGGDAAGIDENGDRAGNFSIRVIRLLSYPPPLLP